MDYSNINTDTNNKEYFTQKKNNNEIRSFLNSTPFFLNKNNNEKISNQNKFANSDESKVFERKNFFLNEEPQKKFCESYPLIAVYLFF